MLFCFQRSLMNGMSQRHVVWLLNLVIVSRFQKYKVLSHSTSLTLAIKQFRNQRSDWTTDLLPLLFYDVSISPLPRPIFIDVTVAGAYSHSNLPVYLIVFLIILPKPNLCPQPSLTR